jgi:hypothetical protein
LTLLQPKQVPDSIDFAQRSCRFDSLISILQKLVTS